MSILITTLTRNENKNLNELASDKNIQLSCLQLGFYLASWGMMRGSCFILQKSVENYRKLIITISKVEPKLWEIDVDNYDDKNIGLLIDCKNKIINALGSNNARTWDTLVTKIMLGVFANVPAYDGYFKKFLKGQGYCQTFNEESLGKIKEFFKENKKVLDLYQIPTLDFKTGKETDLVYTKAKLVDMYGFMDGQKQ